MFKISYDKKITMVQGDTGVIKMRIHNYELSQEDEVRFAIVNKANPSILLCQHSDKKIVLEKQVTVFEKDGSARILIYPYDTEYLQPGKYLYEIQVKTKDGRIDTVVPLTSFTLMDGSIQGEFGQTTPSKPEPTPSEIELRFKRLENEIIPELGNRVTNVENEIDKIKEVLVTDFDSWQECADYCQVNKKVMRIPKGEYTINTPLKVKGVTITGDGANNTIIKLDRCDGFILEQYETQRPVSISNLSIITTSHNMYELCGISFKEQNDGKRSRGYKLDNLYFENLGCAIELTDCFRVGINRVNINNCYRSIIVKGQVVQLVGSDITSNCDIANGEVSNRYGSSKIGIEVKGSNHSGEYQRPESIKFNNTSMVSHDVNLQVSDVLYGSFIQCDFDLSRKQCIVTGAYDGMFLIADSWIATRSITSEPIIEIRNADNLYKKLVIRNNNISVLAGGNSEKCGIGIGVDSNNYYKSGVQIIGNTIQSFTTTKLKYGIYANRTRNIIIKENDVRECLEQDIYGELIEGGIIDDNCTNKIKISSNHPTKAYSTKNNLGTLTIEGTATRYRDFDGKRIASDVVLRNQNLGANETLTVTHNFNLSFDKLQIELYKIVGGEFYPVSGVTIKEYDNNSIKIINKESTVKPIYLKISKV